MTTQPGDPAGAADVSAAQTDDAEALWNEADLADGAAPTGDAPEHEDGSGNDFPADPSDTDTDPEDEPAGDPPASAEPAKPADIWATASPELIQERDRLRSEYAALQQRHRSVEGRVAAYQRRYDELLKQQKAAQDPKAKTDDTDEEDHQAALQKAAEEFPEVVKPLSAQLTRQQAIIDQLRESETSRQQQAAREREELEATATAAVTEQFPDWQSLIQVEDPGGEGMIARPEFVAWYKTQPPAMQRKVERNGDGFVDATEALEVIGAFKGFMERFEAANTPAADGGTPEPTPTTRRQRQLQSAATAPSRPQVARSSGIPRDDAEAAWREFDRLDAQRAARTG